MDELIEMAEAQASVAEVIGATQMRRLIRLPEVIAATCQSRSKIYEMIERDAFPKPAKFGHINVWDEKEVSDWINAHFERR